MSNYQVQPANPARFANDFQIVELTPGARTADESLYLAKNEDLLQRRATDEAKLQARQLSEAALAKGKELGDAFVIQLQSIAMRFAEGKLPAAEALARACEQRGRTLAEIDRLPGKLFSVKVVEDEADASGKKYASDLSILLRSGLPPPHATPSPEKQRLFVSIDAAMSVLKTVCRPPDSAKETPFRRIMRRIRGEPDARRSRQLLDEHVRKLAGIANVGLVDSHTDLAIMALEGLKQDFVAREAARIKNGYLRSLGLSAGITAGVCLLAYAAIETRWVTWGWGDRHSTFLLAGAGAALGTWLSFSIRRVQLSFEQLGVIEEDLLSPSLRVIFVGGLTLSAYLLFWTGAISVEIGSLAVNPAGFERADSIALLLGIFCGLSERTLAGAISGRAEAFVGGIAGAR